MSIHVVQITSHEEQYAPPGRILEVSLVEDTVFLSIGEYTEDSVMSTFTYNGQSIGVKLDDLLSAINTFSVKRVT